MLVKLITGELWRPKKRTSSGSQLEKRWEWIVFQSDLAPKTWRPSRILTWGTKLWKPFAAKGSFPQLPTSLDVFTRRLHNTPGIVTFNEPCTNNILTISIVLDSRASLIITNTYYFFAILLHSVFFNIAKTIFFFVNSHILRNTRYTIKTTVKNPNVWIWSWNK